MTVLLVKGHCFSATSRHQSSRHGLQRVNGTARALQALGASGESKVWQGTGDQDDTDSADRISTRNTLTLIVGFKNK